MNKPAFILALVVVALSSARADTYTIDAAKSQIAFSVHHLLGTARGEFGKFSGTIEVNSDQPERSSVNVKIQVASIDTKIRKRDDHLLSAEFFDAKQFPEITFRSRSAKRTGPDRGDISGDLAMHGVTRPLTLHVRLATPLTASSNPERTRWIVMSDPIRRKDFGLMFGSAAETMSGIGQEVSPAIEIEAVRAR